MDAYRRYAARGKGIYKTEQGHHTVCKECENINARAIQLEKTPGKDPELHQQLVDYYQALYDAGLGVASAVAGRYTGQEKPVDDSTRRGSLGDRLTQRTSQLKSRQSDECTNFIQLVRLRQYTNSATAWARYDELKQQLQDAGLRDEAARLIDEWEADEEVC
jgi:hypothetical protein